MSANPETSTQEQAPQPRRSRWRRWSMELLVLVLILTAVQWWQTRDMATGAAPPLTGTLLDGGVVNLAAEQGRPVLVHFWAEWCPICGLEQGSIDAIAKDYRVITVATTSGGDAEVRAHMQREGLSFPVVVDEEGELARAWGVSGVPASFVIDPAGQVAHAMKGYTSGIGFRVRLWLAGL